MRLLALLLLLLGSPALAQRIEPTLELSAVRVEVTWVKGSDLAEIRRRYESGPPRFSKGAVMATENGFAVLAKRNGENVCLIFVEQPIVVDDERTMTLGHELFHCLAGAYH